MEPSVVAVPTFLSACCNNEAAFGTGAATTGAEAGVDTTEGGDTAEEITIGGGTGGNPLLAPSPEGETTELVSLFTVTSGPSVNAGSLVDFDIGFTSEDSTALSIAFTS